MFSDSARELSTERLTLEPLRQDHAKEMAGVLADTSLYEFIGDDPPTEVELAERYRRQVAGPLAEEERWLNWIVRRSDTAEAIGFVQATVTADRADVAWLIGVEHQRRGFACEAGSEMVEHLSTNAVTHLIAHIAVGHAGSERVAHRLGFERTGSFDQDGEELWLRSSGPAT